MLDPDFLRQIPRAGVVYAWGSLHHTGNMWQAIRNAGLLVDAGGLFYVTIYNRVEGRKGSAFWLTVKRRDNSSSPLRKRLMEWTLFRAMACFLPWLPARAFDVSAGLRPRAGNELLDGRS